MLSAGLPGGEEGEGGSLALHLRQGLHEVCPGRPGRAVGPAAVRHRVQPGHLHPFSEVALHQHRPPVLSAGPAGPGQGLRRAQPPRAWNQRLLNSRSRPKAITESTKRTMISAPLLCCSSSVEPVYRWLAQSDPPSMKGDLLPGRRSTVHACDVHGPAASVWNIDPEFVFAPLPVLYRQSALC